jgi:amidohydrolase
MEKTELQAFLLEQFYWFHQYPELSGGEFKTTARIRQILSDRGIEILDSGLTTGLVGRIQGGEDGPVVALRADIDALPITEGTDLGYRSKNDGVMHACGHDFHTTALLGVALLLNDTKNDWKGTVKLVFQSAEETAAGAAEALASGTLEDMREIYGLHVAPEAAPGIVAVNPGATCAAVGSFRIAITGKGGHAGYPHQSVDPVLIMGQLIVSAQSIVSRFSDPFDPVVVSITKAEAGSAWNVIPPTARLEGTIRTMNTEVYQKTVEKLRQICGGVAMANGAHIEMDDTFLAPAVNNDRGLTAFAAETARALGFQVVPCVPAMGAEDFALYQQRIPGVFLQIGVGSPHGLHHPQFCANVDPLADAAILLATLAKTALNRLSAADNR